MACGYTLPGSAACAVALAKTVTRVRHRERALGETSTRRYHDCVSRTLLVMALALGVPSALAQHSASGADGSLALPPTAEAPPPSASIFQIWTPRGRPRNDPAALPLRDSARDAAALYEPLTDDPALKCIPPGMPSMLDTPHPIELVDSGEHIAMRFEEWDAERTIYMNPRRGPPNQEPSPHGVSFGRWEGHTLAVFTLYIDYPYFDALGTPQSAAVTVLERYTPSEDGTRLDWVTTVTDEATFTAPVVRNGFMAFEPGQTIEPYGCTLVGAAAP
jgi:hypothetical protein